jgi:predicted transposase YbfD/YdcC
MSSTLLSHFEDLPDPRVDRTKRYPLIEIVFLIIAGTLCGCEGWKQVKDFGEMKLDWLRKFLPYANGIPVDDTLARVMRKLDTKAFQSRFLSWMQAVCDVTQGDIVPIDGKTLRGSHDNASGKAAIHRVSAWSSKNGVVLGQEKTAEKSNEITAIPELLEVLELKGCIVTIDAMGCQTDIAKKIMSKKADYVLALKGNQGKLHEETKDYFEAGLAENWKYMEVDYYEEYDAGHGRIEYRQCFAITPKAAHIPSCSKWPGLNSIAMVKSRREMKDKTTEDTRFYISSFDKNAKKTLEAVRQHWAIENSLHWTLDVSFREDECRIRKEAAPENFAIMRHIALNLLKSDTTVNASVKRKKLMAALDDDLREAIICQALQKIQI